MSNIKPLYDRVVIKRTEEEKVSAGGIVIPDSATEKPIKGEVRDLFRRPLPAAELKRYDAVVFDPPRAGAAAQAAE